MVQNSLTQFSFTTSIPITTSISGEYAQAKRLEKFIKYYENKKGKKLSKSQIVDKVTLKELKKLGFKNYKQLAESSQLYKGISRAFNEVRDMTLSTRSFSEFFWSNVEEVYKSEGF